MKQALLAPALLLLGGCAASSTADTAGQRELAELLAGRTEGPSQRCIPTIPSQSVRVVGGTMVYRDGAREWVSRPVGCPDGTLRGDPIPIIRAFGQQLCENDQFQTVQRGLSIPGAVCRFGPFVPYTKPR